MHYIFFFILVLSALIYPQDSISGTTKPFLEVDVAVSEIGIIAEIHAKEGDTVRAGQKIAHLDNSLLESSLKIAEARAESKGAIDAAQTGMKLAQKKLKKISLLEQQNHIRVEEVEQAQAEVDIAAANLLSAKENQRIQRYEVDRIKRQINNRIIHAPVDGIIRESLKDKGESISPNEPLCKLVQLNPIKIVAYPSFKQALPLKMGQRVKVRITYNKKIYDGTISFIDPVTDAASDTVKIIITVPNEKYEIKTGVLCQIKP